MTEATAGTTAEATTGARAGRGAGAVEGPEGACGCRSCRGSRGGPSAARRRPRARRCARAFRGPRTPTSPGRLPPGRGQARSRSPTGRRIPGLTPIRVGRMAATPFAFLRGSAGLMAYDLARTPTTGIGAQICGDAHAANFGLYGDARGGLVIDLNDFDETVHGPLGVGPQAARRVDRPGGPGGRRRRGHLPRGGPRHRGRLPAHHAAAGEAPRAGRLERHRGRGTRLPHRRPRPARHAGAGGREGAGQHQRALRRQVDRGHRGRRTALRRRPAGAAPGDGPRGGGGRGPPWSGTWPRSPGPAPAAARYAVHDVAFRVVGTGSVGTRSYVLLLDHRGEPSCSR